MQDQALWVASVSRLFENESEDENDDEQKKPKSPQPQGGETTMPRATPWVSSPHGTKPQRGETTFGSDENSTSPGLTKKYSCSEKINLFNLTPI